MALALSIYKKILEDKKLELARREQRLRAEDPFGDQDRLTNNAAVDADAAEQFGHENVEAMLQEIERNMADTDRALDRIAEGNYGKCANCGKSIEENRLKIEPAAEYCISCQNAIK